MENQSFKQQIKNNYALILVILAVGVLISTVIYISVGKNSTTSLGANSNQQQTPQPQVQSAVDISKVNITSSPFVGNNNAPVVIAFWEDYQCPFCKRLEGDAIAQIYDTYVKTGKVKMVFKDYEFLGADSQTLGQFARAVWQVAPQKFWQWRKVMFENQGTENTGWATHEKIMSIATATLGAQDTQKASQLAASNSSDYQTNIDADKTEGTSFGINGTPGAIIGNQLISGAQPYSIFQTAIDAELKNK